MLGKGGGGGGGREGGDGKFNIMSVLESQLKTIFQGLIKPILF